MNCRSMRRHKAYMSS